MSTKARPRVELPDKSPRRSSICSALRQQSRPMWRLRDERPDARATRSDRRNAGLMQRLFPTAIAHAGRMSSSTPILYSRHRSPINIAAHDFFLRRTLSLSGTLAEIPQSAVETLLLGPKRTRKGVGLVSLAFLLFAAKLLTDGAPSSRQRGKRHSINCHYANGDLSSRCVPKAR